MTMKENQIAAVFDSDSFGRETDSLTLGSKETHELNDSRIDANPILVEAKDRDLSSNCKVMDDLSTDNENGTIDSPTKEGENGLSLHLSSWDKDADSLSSDSYDMDKEQRSPEHENSATVAEFVDRDQSDSRDSSSPCNGASALFKADTNMFTDKSVLECDVPELEVCYKEIDCQILKDICVDEGRADNYINVIESFEDEKPGHLYPQPPNDNDHFESPEESYQQPPNDNDHFESTEESSLEHSDGLHADQCGSEETIDPKMLVSQQSLESSSDNLFKKDSAKHCNSESLTQTVEANCGATGEAEICSSEDGSHVDRKLSMEDFSEEKKVMQPPNQILIGQAVPESHAASLTEAGGTGEDVQDSSLLYKSKVVENGIITFNFNSSAPVVVANGITENVKEQASDSSDVPKDVSASIIIENVQEQPLINKDECLRSEDTNGENAHDQPPEHEDSTDGPAQIPSNKSQSSTNDVQFIEPSVPIHEQRNSGNISVLSQLQHDEGETSFSAASLITYSGPIAFSGSLSHRSDGSTTSAKSFAFPVLQSEWNSSPVRMAKADRKHFRKHKGWRSGLLCCRF